MAKTGRPDKLTAEVHERIVMASRSGSSRTAAAEYARIHRSTLARWMQLGHPDGTLVKHQRYRDLRADVEQAEAEAHVRDATLLAKAAESDWRAALARLQHIHWPRERAQSATAVSTGPTATDTPASPDPGGGAIDAANPKERELLSALLRNRQTDRAG